MGPFCDGGGYWLCVPKPWNGRKFTNMDDSSDRHIKSRRLEKIVRKLRSTAKRRNSYHSLYREGQSLFILPKTLSKSVRQWKHYEDRFKQWLDNHHIGINRNSQPNSSFPTHGHYTSSSGDVSYVSHNSTYEDDPLRAFYTIWYLNMNKVSKNKLSTTGGIFEYIGSVWESDPVKRSILKSPKGGISGRIENRLSLSAKARVTLQKWSRVVSHYNVGEESGEDDDPLDMWNHCMENSMIRHDTNVCSPVSATPFRNSSLRQRMHETSMATGSNGTVECLVSTSTSHSSGKLFINSSTMNASNTGNDESSPLDALSPKDSLVVKVSHTRTQVGSVRGDTGIHSNISSGSVRRSQRILANAKQKTTTPETTKTPVNSKKNSATNSSKKSASSSAKNSRYECSSTRLRADNTSILTPHIKKSGTKKRSVAQYSGLSEDINKVNLSSSTPIITSKSKKSKSWY